MIGNADGARTSHFVELTETDCRHKLASRTTGRVGWTFGSAQYVLPVTYALYTDRVVFRTSPYGVLAQLAQPTNVAFEIDEIDERSGRGWSVLLQGRTEAVVLTFDLATLWADPGLVPWAPGTRNLFIAVTPHTISGRSVQAPFAD
jgi:uncharacterized protein